MPAARETNYREVNFDGLVGPTHNYAGLSPGNIASTRNKELSSYPRKAALQGLQKAWALAQRGFPQALLPPLERPSLRALRAFGFSGNNEAAILAKAHAEGPALLACAASASSMWTANAATTAPSVDTADRRLHLSPANLSSMLHRSLEAAETRSILQAIFPSEEHFCIHPPLPGGQSMRDEGAANHTRLAVDHGSPGLHLFVYGVDESDPTANAPKRFPARQTRLASEAIARRHQLHADATLFLPQNPHAIDAGVFHNDVIAVGNCSFFFAHQAAFANPHTDFAKLQHAFEKRCKQALRLTIVAEDAISLAECIRTYLFNSQLLQLEPDRYLLVAPSECAASPTVSNHVQSLLQDASCPLAEAIFFDLRESMQNGGGPACLRQRIVLNDAEHAAIKARVFLDAVLYQQLVQWVNVHYREILHFNDLADPLLLDESRRALDELSRLLRLGNVYDFQK